MNNVTKILFFSVAMLGGLQSNCVFAKDSGESTKHSKSAPQELVERLMSEALGIVSSDVTKEQFGEKIKKVILETFSTEKIARFMLGVHTKQIGKEDLSKFVESCVSAMISFYSSKLYEYRNATFEVISVKKRSTDHYIVLTKVFKDGKKSEKNSLVIVWSVFITNGAPLVFDVLISGISMIQAQRGEISRRIKKNGIKKFLMDFIEENKPHDK
ncbi:hypothetical protein FACS189449_03750 [Alphaproteobacteria bacterium]|nr:hypothetical protein FACS189449_03750 [Alphaproteobacteria bacterium]